MYIYPWRRLWQVSWQHHLPLKLSSCMIYPTNQSLICIRLISVVTIFLLFRDRIIVFVFSPSLFQFALTFPSIFPFSLTFPSIFPFSLTFPSVTYFSLTFPSLFQFAQTFPSIFQFSLTFPSIFQFPWPSPNFSSFPWPSSQFFTFPWPSHHFCSFPQPFQFPNHSFSMTFQFPCPCVKFIMNHRFVMLLGNLLLEHREQATQQDHPPWHICMVLVEMDTQRGGTWGKVKKKKKEKKEAPAIWCRLPHCSCWTRS